MFQRSEKSILQSLEINAPVPAVPIIRIVIFNWLGAHRAGAGVPLSHLFIYLFNIYEIFYLLIYYFIK